MIKQLFDIVLAMFFIVFNYREKVEQIQKIRSDLHEKGLKILNMSQISECIIIMKLICFCKFW